MAGKHIAARGAHDPVRHRTRRRAGRFVLAVLVVFLLAAAGTATVLALRGRTHHPSVAAASLSCIGEGFGAGDRGSVRRSSCRRYRRSMDRVSPGRTGPLHPRRGH